MSATLLAGALVLDALVGEPRWLWTRVPHPVVVIGKLISWLDQKLNTGPGHRIKGVLTTAIIVTISVLTGIVISALPFGWVFEVIIAAILIAQKSLTQHVKAVADALRISLADGKRSVARIVGRDTTDMQQSDVSRAAIESAAENFSDGVIAPAFWFLIGGLPGILIYKAVNTADSMIGYRTARYEEFGWAAARLDDVLNWIPARFTALLFLVANRLYADWTDIIADAKLHRSPNAGWPEAALSRGLGVALAGPRNYDGERQDYPFVNDGAAVDIGAAEIDKTVRALWQAWFVFLALILAISVLWAAI